MHRHYVHSQMNHLGYFKFPPTNIIRVHYKRNEAQRDAKCSHVTRGIVLSGKEREIQKKFYPPVQGHIEQRDLV